MQKFMKKKNPWLIVEAAKVGDTDINELANWAQAYVVEEKDAISHDTFEALNVRTPDGMIRASQGMYVAKIQGLFFVAQPGEFEDTFELVEEIEEPEDQGYIRGPRQI